MGWTTSEIFGAFVKDSFNRTNAFDLDADNLKAALFDGTITPDQTVAAASSAYGAGVWASGGVLDAVGWPAVGRQLLSVTSTSQTSGSDYIYILDAADTVSANGTTTIVGAYGVLVYDDTLASVVVDQGICFNYFGGSNSVANGTFTTVWAALGILTIYL